MNQYQYVNGNPVGALDPSGLAKIYISYRPVGPGVHVFLIIVDEDSGKMWTIAGGPFHKGGSGPLTNFSEPAREGNYDSIDPDFPNSKNFANAALLKHDGRTGLWWFNKCNSIGEEIESFKIDYDVLTTNSNAFAYTVIRRAGLGDELDVTNTKRHISPKPETILEWRSRYGSVYAPGWRTLLIWGNPPRINK